MKLLTARVGRKKCVGLESPAVQVVGLLVLAAYFLGLIWPSYKDNRDPVVALVTGQ
ncbi:hypothetical protein P5W99_00785 [Paraburkholderia sp. A3BS-1L]|uniref:hypothetical protein n=1 Tax=Paraburkholderia sp. A3BS-1L TaxID=3028375 RepID=UPI003DA8BE69